VLFGGYKGAEIRLNDMYLLDTGIASIIIV